MAKRALSVQAKEDGEVQWENIFTLGATSKTRYVVLSLMVAVALISLAQP